VLYRFQVSPEEAGVTRIHSVAFGVSISWSIIAHGLVNLIWINTLEQHSLFIF
jgi:hypothetical protein